MKAVLHSLHSPDVQDLSELEGMTGFEIFVEAEIGPMGRPGSEIFGVRVIASPDAESNEWVDREIHVSQFDLDAVRQSIQRRVEVASGRNWTELAEHLASHFYWEFENYRP